MSKGWFLVALTMVLTMGNVVPQLRAVESFTVTNTNDSGDGSLRWAIMQANSNPGIDIIEFDIFGEEVHTITPTSALPEITDPVVIDGLTQPGADCATWPPTLLIELDGSRTGAGVFGLSITAGESTVRGLVVNRFSYAGIHLDINGNNTITCNYLGTDRTGTVDLVGNYHGLWVLNSANNVIGGSTEADRNLISANGFGYAVGGSGVRIQGYTATGNRVIGNFIGTDGLGTSPLGNAIAGVQILNAPGNIIGGSSVDERNIISSNQRHGVWLSGSSSTGTAVLGNYVGTDLGGTRNLGNRFHGVYIDEVPSSQIGGLQAMDGNLISGNGGSGVRIEGSAATENLIRGNYIGLEANGTGRLDNGDSGVYIQGAPNNTIGGDTEAARNVISGNAGSGVSILGSGATGNVVQGNYIGTQANGMAALHNTGSGVHIKNAPNNLVGGRTGGAGNLLSSNNCHGVYIGGSSGTRNLVQGNHIGTGPAGIESLGNGGHGVLVQDEASANEVGGSSGSESNLIRNNGEDGISIESGTSNLISSNSISSNAGLGIDLGLDGVTPNDPGDGDAGANNLQNFPELISVALSDGTPTITGRLDSTSDTAFRLEFFYSAAPDPTDYGEGAAFIGAHLVTTDSVGKANFVVSSCTQVPEAPCISATAIDPDNNTSEFSRVYCIPIPVSIWDLKAFPELHRNVVEWATEGELHTLGFNLYRAESVEGTRNQLNDSLIDAQVPGSSLGADYRWEDGDVLPGVTYYYWLEDVSIYNTSRLHGPVSSAIPNLLSVFEAYPEFHHNVIEWTTSVEMEIVGFNLYRANSVEGATSKLNNSLIDAQLPGSPLGAAYRWEDGDALPGVTYYYWLEDVSIYDTSRLNGPVSSTVLTFTNYLPLVLATTSIFLTTVVEQP